MLTLYKFSAASENEPIVFGSARPGYSNEKVNKWIEFMQTAKKSFECGEKWRLDEEQPASGELRIRGS